MLAGKLSRQVIDFSSNVYLLPLQGTVGRSVYGVACSLQIYTSLGPSRESVFIQISDYLNIMIGFLFLLNRGTIEIKHY